MDGWSDFPTISLPRKKKRKENPLSLSSKRILLLLSSLHITCTRKAQNSSVPEGIPILRPFLGSHCQPAGMQSTDSASHPSPQETDTTWTLEDRSLPVVLTFILLLFFLVGFFTLYLFRYVMDYLRRLRQTPVAAPRGLPASVIASFPTFAYSSVKDLQHGNDKLECTVCLAEFSDDDVLRMLTGCSHVFHLECIDLWLGTHTTCPNCRWDLGQGKEKKVEIVITMPERNSSRERQDEATTEMHGQRNSFKEDANETEGDHRDMDGRRLQTEQRPAGQLSISDSTSSSTDGHHDQTGRRSCTMQSGIEVVHSGLLKSEGSSNEIR